MVCTIQQMKQTVTLVQSIGKKLALQKLYKNTLAIIK